MFDNILHKGNYQIYLQFFKKQFNCECGKTEENLINKVRFNTVEYRTAIAMHTNGAHICIKNQMLGCANKVSSFCDTPISVLICFDSTYVKIC